MCNIKRPWPGYPGGALFYDSIRYVGYYSTLCERILGRIQHSLRLVEFQIFYGYADVLEYFVQSLADVSESDSTVVGEVLLDQYVKIETSHFGDSENTDTTEGSGSYGKDFTLCNVSTQLVVCGRL